MDKKTKIYYSILAGMCGDAYGYPIEFDNYETISQTTKKPKAWFKSSKLSSPLNKTSIEVSDDSQMTLFTLKAVLETSDFTSLDKFFENYKNWLFTQKNDFRTQDKHTDFLLKQKSLYKIQAPGMTCLSSLSITKDPNDIPTPTNPINNSKGCGGIMRTLPLNLPNLTKDQLWNLSCNVSALTHGHIDGYVSSACFNIVVYYLLNTSKDFDTNIYQALCYLKHKLETYPENKTYHYISDIKTMLENNIKFDLKGNQLTHLLDEGWTGESSLAIALYSVIQADNWEQLMMTSAWHSGDSDNTCSLACQLMAFKRSLPKFILKNKTKIDVFYIINDLLNK